MEVSDRVTHRAIRGLPSLGSLDPPGHPLRAPVHVLDSLVLRSRGLPPKPSRVGMSSKRTLGPRPKPQRSSSIPCSTACRFPSAVQVDGGSEFAAEFEQACQQRGLPLFVLPP